MNKCQRRGIVTGFKSLHLMFYVFVFCFDNADPLSAPNEGKGGG